MLFLIVAIITFAILSLTVLFPVSVLNAKGSKLYTEAQIIKASGITSDDNLFMVNEEDITEKIRHKLPYIDTVEIKRNLPDAMFINVTDAKEYSCYFWKGEYYTVSRRGYVLNKYSDPPQGLFVVMCDEKDIECEVGYALEFKKEILEQRIENISELLKNEGIAIDRIDVSNPISLSVKVCGRFEVLLGTSANLDKKIAHLGGMVKSIDPQKTGKINLSMWTSDKTQGSFVEGEIG
jgi:cell division septal protein FtsQ